MRSSLRSTARLGALALMVAAVGFGLVGCDLSTGPSKFQQDTTENPGTGGTTSVSDAGLPVSLPLG